MGGSGQLKKYWAMLGRVMQQGWVAALQLLLMMASSVRLRIWSTPAALLG